MVLSDAKSKLGKNGLNPSRNCLCGHIVLLGRFLIIVSNKRSNKKHSFCKMLLKSILQIVNIALLRRWLWVRVPPNPSLLCGFESPLSR